MKTRNIENKLALVGAIIVLIGVSMAAGSAFGADFANVVNTDVAEQNAADETIIGARKANTEAAAEAAKALEAENALDLDIQLADLTSTLIADAE
ncbi:MAG: hypothetical protein GY783_03840 [Gammaproteobacteria bacterium]|nr:hypothetical protein [Gammaproteobacteria bacterium]